MAIYLGDEQNLARKILSFYIGVNGVARKVTKAYVGDANGIARLFYTAHTHDYNIYNDDIYFDDDIDEYDHFYTMSCSCGDTMDVREQHYFGEQCTIKEPTCTEVGTGAYRCECGKVEDALTFEIATIDHNPVEKEGKEPTCVQYGLTAGTECSMCGTRLSGLDLIDPLGHDYSDATCTEPATCSRCGATTGVALGHDYQATEHAFEDADGNVYQKYMCTRCGDIYTEKVNG